MPCASKRMCVLLLLLLLAAVGAWTSPGVRCWSLTCAIACLMKRFAAALSTAVFPAMWGVSRREEGRGEGRETDSSRGLLRS